MSIHQPDDTSNHNASPFNNLPMVVVGLVMVLSVIEILFSLSGRGLIGGPEAIAWRRDAIYQYALIGEFVTPYLDTGRYVPEILMRFVTYSFVHQDFVSTAFVVVFILALGKMTAEAFGSAAFLAVYFTSTLVGAIIYWVIFREQAVLIGGYTGAFGLIGAFTFVRWVNLSVTGSNQYQAFYLIGLFMGMRLLFGVLFGGHTDWVAELSGFFVGFFMSFVVAPGGAKAILNHIRRN
ncbi:rhomboid family intramembrane serine protease [Falsihalocynthiibacter sp. SS001]|uniref:rhomboid family intramembrane serine protease n=1 Tax=Falsihalocynthiibacter sp. SS001 TaxID=3349698 RepID=UPI0036D3A52A